MSKTLNELEEKIKARQGEIYQAEQNAMSELAQSLRELYTQEVTIMRKDMLRTRIYMQVLPIITIVLAIAISIVSLLVVGKILMRNGEELAQQHKEMREIEAQLESYKQITKTYKEGIEVKRKPKVAQLTNGNWIVEF
jgi:hypothetical protein